MKIFLNLIILQSTTAKIWKEIKPSLVWIFYGFESEVRDPAAWWGYESLRNKDCQISVNYHMPWDLIITTTRKSNPDFIHLAVTHAPVPIERYYKKKLSFSEKNDTIIASAFITKCGNWYSDTNDRFNILSNLSTMIPIHSFGKCVQTIQVKDLPYCQGIPYDKEYGWNFEEKVCILERYKFNLAFENSNDESYVSEKYWHGNSHLLSHIQFIFFLKF